MKIKDFTIYNVSIPLKLKIKHHLSSRNKTDNIVLKITLENGIAGFGECLPRKYVTGETTASVLSDLKKELSLLKLKNFQSINEVVDYITTINLGCGKCCLELAMLDAYGKHFKKSISSIIPGTKKSPVYSGVIPMLGFFGTALLSVRYRLAGINNIKVKVGDKYDFKRLQTVRKILPDANLRIDSNCAWNTGKAIEKLKSFSAFNISAVEEPIPKNDYQGLKKIRQISGMPVIADESLCTYEDAKSLIKHKSCDIFDIRLSKNGGLLNSLKLIALARKHNIKVMIGSQVGETGILSAAGRIIAEKSSPVYTEGSYDAMLLKDNITKNISFGKHGTGQSVSGYGLGIIVNEKKLEKYSRSLQ